MLFVASKRNVSKLVTLQEAVTPILRKTSVKRKKNRAKARKVKF